MNNLAPYTIPNLKTYKNGSQKLIGVRTIKWFSTPMRTVLVTRQGKHQPIKYTVFNPGSRQNIIQWMEEDYGYTFPFYTEAGGIKADKDSLVNMSNPAGKMLERYLKVTKDLSMVSPDAKNGYLKHYKESTHSIHHRVDLLGANTHRATHSKPNLAQVPAAKEFRELFTAAPGKVVVGADLANIEIRVLAHYLSKYDNGLYAEAVLSKDMHWYHAKLAGFWTEDDRDWPDDNHKDQRTPAMKAARTASKAFFFSWVYGSGNTIRGHTLWFEGCLPSYTKEEYKLAEKSVVGRVKQINGKDYFPLKKDLFILYDPKLILQTIYGKRIADTFLNKVVGIKELITACKKESKDTGKIKAIDGRYLPVRSPHSSLNLLLQGSAGIIAKKWMVNFHSLAAKAGLPHGVEWSQMAFVHDEFQSQCTECYATKLGDLKVEGCNMIQAQFNMALPIEADYLIGANWSETH